MPAAQYPFIDIAVHRAVRGRFAQGEALVLFSADMAHVLWANGPGAAFFGNQLIYDFLEQGPNRQDVSFRQLAVTAGQLGSTGDSRTLLVRVPSGFRRIPVQANVEMVEIRAGEPAVLFAVPAPDAARNTAELCRRLLSGFDDPDTHMAVLDAEGTVLAASDEFPQLGITAHTAKTFIGMVNGDASRLLKRPLPTSRGHLPAAIAKISDAPALHLVFVVETILGNMGPSDDFRETPPSEAAPAVEAVAAAAAGLEAEAAEAAAVQTDVPETADDVETIAGSADHDAAQEEFPHFAEEPSIVDIIEPEPAALIEDQPETEEEPVSLLDVEQVAPSAEAEEEVVESPAAISAPAQKVAPAAAEGAVPAPDAFAYQRNGRATRFVWKIDAEGRFSEVSNEFAAAVGPHAAAITGVAFVDLAALFNLDPEGKILELLKKRDTWSGKTIYWPVEGTTLRVPVDLAALPTYTRNREFDGFRGFGVVRMADAVEDLHKTGLSLTGDVAPAPEVLEPENIMSEQAAEADVAAAEEPAPELTPEPEEPIAWAEPEALTEEETPASSDIEDEDVESAVDEAVSHEDADKIDLSGPPDTAPDTTEPPREEPPALYISETPSRRHSDKVIQLEERRGRGKEGLTAGEAAAFREIARKLDHLGPTAKSDAAPEAPEDNKTPRPTDNRIEIRDEAKPETEPTTPVAPAEVTPDAQTGPVPEAASIKAAEAYLSPGARKEIGLNTDIIDLMPVALLVHVGDRLLHGNPEFLKLTGYANLQTLDDAGGLDALLQRQDLEGAESNASQIVVVRADDELVPVTARLQSIRWDQSSALLLSLVPLETGAQKEEQPAAVEPSGEMADELASLRVEAEELRSILETATDGVVIIGTEGEIRSMNRAASALFNYDGEETRGKPFVMLFAHESQKAILDYLSGLAGLGVASVLNDGREVIGREASGGFLPLFMTIGRLTSSNGYCAVIRDITQWKRTEDELRSAKRAAETANAHKSDFLARVSHEIRTPLNAIIGFADIMANEHFGPIGHSRYSEYASDIVRSGRHVLDIVNDLLDISKIEAGEMDLDFTAVGLNETVSQAVSIVQPQANSQRVIIRTALSQAVPSVVADLRSVKQIVLNILANAIRFTPSGGQIIVSTAYEPNGSVVLRIRDTGIGMSRSELEQAMKPFRQVTTGSHARGDGTGLGLPLTKAMVDANRASFSIHSAPNEGTLVEITFPSPRVLAD